MDGRFDGDGGEGRVDVIGEFFDSNEWQWRLACTVVQGVVGVLVANLDLVVGWCVLDPAVRGLVVALVMAVLSPLMAEIGGGE